MKNTMVVVNWILLVSSIFALIIFIIMAFGGISYPFVAIGLVFAIIYFLANLSAIED